MALICFLTPCQPVLSLHTTKASTALQNLLRSVRQRRSEHVSGAFSSVFNSFALQELKRLHNRQAIALLRPTGYFAFQVPLDPEAQRSLEPGSLSRTHSGRSSS